MSEPTLIHGTFTVERHFPATPERVFAAFSDIAKKQRWFAEGEGFALDSYEMDFRVGGFERARFRFLGAGGPDGMPMGNDTIYLDIVPDRRIVSAYTMTVGEKRISSSLATIEIIATDKGTHLVSTEQGAYFEGGREAVKGREEGWRGLLEELAKQLG